MASPRAKPFSLAAECALVLFAANVALVVFWFNLGHSHTFAQTALALSIPAAAAVAVALLGLATPNLFRCGRHGWPQIVLLPPVCTSLILVLVSLATTGYTGIQRAPEAIRPVFHWLDSRVLIQSLFAQAAALWFVALLRSKD